MVAHPLEPALPIWALQASVTVAAWPAAGVSVNSAAASSDSDTAADPTRAPPVTVLILPRLFAPDARGRAVGLAGSSARSRKVRARRASCPRVSRRILPLTSMAH